MGRLRSGSEGATIALVYQCLCDAGHAGRAIDRGQLAAVMSRHLRMGDRTLKRFLYAGQSAGYWRLDDARIPRDLQARLGPPRIRIAVQPAQLVGEAEAVDSVV